MFGGGTPGPSQDPASPTGWFPAKFVEVLDERSKEVRVVQGRAAPASPLQGLPPLGQGLCPEQWLEDRERVTGCRCRVGPLRPRPAPNSTPLRGMTL